MGQYDGKIRICASLCSKNAAICAEKGQWRSDRWYAHISKSNALFVRIHYANAVLLSGFTAFDPKIHIEFGNSHGVTKDVAVVVASAFTFVFTFHTIRIISKTTKMRSSARKRPVQHNQLNFSACSRLKVKSSHNSVLRWQHIQSDWMKVRFHFAKAVCSHKIDLYPFHAMYLNVSVVTFALWQHPIGSNVRNCYPKSSNLGNKKGINENGADFTIIGQYTVRATQTQTCWRFQDPRSIRTLTIMVHSN